jgi:hypothetical protein
LVFNGLSGVLLSQSSRKLSVLENFTSHALPNRGKAGSGMAGFGRGAARKTELVYPKSRLRRAKITLRQ